MSSDFRIVRCAVVPVCAASLVVSLIAPSSARAVPRATPPPTGVGLIKLGGALDSSGAARRLSSYSVVIVGDEDARRVAGLRARSLIYGCAVNVPSAAWSATCGVPWATSVAHGWILKDAAGNDAPYTDGGSFLADVGDPAYQKAWLATIVSLIKASGVRGVMIDNVDGATINYGDPPAKYPTSASWRAAMQSFLDAAARGLRARGFYVALNASMFDTQTANWRTLLGSPDDGSQQIWWIRRIARDADGIVSEAWEENYDGSYGLRATGPNSNQGWDGWARMPAVVQRLGKDFIPITYGTSDDAGIAKSTYLKASFLLGYDGGRSAFIYETGSSSDPWMGGAPWTANVGKPTTPRQRVGVGWRRTFTRGLVLVNPSPTTAQRFVLERRYWSATTSSDHSVTLSPVSAQILRRPGG